jgi:uncharacterized protein (TIGR00251 family)
VRAPDGAPVRHDDGSVWLVVHAQPGARQTAFAGVYGDALKIRVAAPAESGRANRALCVFLADAFGVAPAAVTLMSGESARCKRLRVIGPLQWPPALAEWQ